LREAPDPATVITVGTVGTLQYMPKEEFAAFFAAMKSAPNRKAIVLSEISQYGITTGHKSTYRAHQTYNHYYITLLQNFGFSVIDAEAFCWKEPIR
jgi:hypothetical protein